MTTDCANRSRAGVWILAGVLLSAGARFLPSGPSDAHERNAAEQSSEPGAERAVSPPATSPAPVSRILAGVAVEPQRTEDATQQDLSDWAALDADEPGDESLERVAESARTMALRDPWSASRAHAALPRGAARQVLLEQLACVWGETDFDAARRWASSLEEGGEQQSALLQLASERLRDDPADAAEMAFTLAPGPDRDGVLVRALSQWIGSDYEGAAARCDRTPLAPELLAGLVPALAEADPGATAEWVLGRFPPGSLQTHALAEVLGRWNQQDPETAGMWAPRVGGWGSGGVSGAPIPGLGSGPETFYTP